MTEDFGKSAQLESIFVQIWIDLGHGSLRPGHPFRTPVLASRGERGPDARTVVLRHADPARRQLLCHTDIRSPKARELQANPNVTWLFYHPVNQTQLRIRGQVAISHDDELARARWKHSAEHSRDCYRAALAPGTPAASPLAPPLLESGFENFAVIDCRVVAIDWLYLQQQGHLRARFAWSGERWDNDWLAP